MPENRNIINALPLVADVLGRKYGVRVLIGGSRAYTNGKDIHIPSLPLDADETVMNLARGYLDHEAAHLRITDFEALEAASLTEVEKHVWNIIEDYMVERQLGEIYPGCIQNFQWLIRHLFLKDNSREKESSPLSAILNWMLISLRAISVPELERELGHLKRNLDKDCPGFRQQLEPLVREIPLYCSSTKDCLAQAKKIVKALNQYAANQKPTDGNRPNAKKSDDLARQSITSVKNPQSSGSTASFPKTNQDQDNGNQVSPSESNDFVEPPTQINGSGNGQSSTPPRIELDIESHAAKSLQEILAHPVELKNQDIGSLAGKLLEGENENIQHNQLGIAVSKPSIATAFSISELAEIRKTTIALRTRMTALLQAQVRVRNRLGRTGRITPGHLARIATGDAKVFEKLTVKQGINTAIHILLDTSSSMRKESRITLACRACYAVADALQNIPGVGVAVTSFPNGPYMPYGENEPHWATVGKILAHKQKIHPKFRISANGWTPLAEAVWWVLQQMKPLSENRKLMLIISDGAPDNMDEAINALNVCRTHGIQVYGIGIQTWAMQRLLPVKQTQVIFDLNELVPAIFGILQTKLINTTGGLHESAA